MRQLGFERFSLVGHDRGAYVAFRLAMDHPEVVECLVLMDAAPIGGALARCNARFASGWWHWFFLGQTAKPAERVILADPETWYDADRDDLRDLYDDPLGIWKSWSDDVRAVVLDCGHHMAGEAPDDLAAALREFLGA
jgi:haloacetate dehalogenase